MPVTKHCQKNWHTTETDRTSRITLYTSPPSSSSCSSSLSSPPSSSTSLSSSTTLPSFLFNKPRRYHSHTCSIFDSMHSSKHQRCQHNFEIGSQRPPSIFPFPFPPFSFLPSSFPLPQTTPLHQVTPTVFSHQPTLAILTAVLCKCVMSINNNHNMERLLHSTYNILQMIR